MWFNKDVRIEEINSLGKNTMGEFIGIQFTERGEDYLVATMPVNDKTRQPYGILHGGASVVLAETLGSVASALIIDNEKFICVGLEINANHIKSIREGFVIGTTKPIHIGKSTHVWEIKITNKDNELICISRLTVAILEKKQ